MNKLVIGLVIDEFKKIGRGLNVLSLFLTITTIVISLSTNGDSLILLKIFLIVMLFFAGIGNYIFYLMINALKRIYKKWL